MCNEENVLSLSRIHGDLGLISSSLVKNGIVEKGGVHRTYRLWQDDMAFQVETAEEKRDKLGFG